MSSDDDNIRAAIVARAEELDYSAYLIGRQAGIDPGTIKRYFEGRTQMTSLNISRVCDVLGLELRKIKGR